ncbi:bifunctional adenosylcobinamide kinase/adenosylcobinamide-phosphate guanylyltransferase [Simiduia agarivorans]|uniref:Bifunctional adenosylcobalamin biosynthesis protein n=1 Tax=Simiduia agarivorans (strain DSM 21679 / JCM 13881 / BCRC 17597 / SA1) TaxID=1117647 RepID=K4KZD9_SIMAS|nr:bifunctional adenosylcobinamide kinase/adenosylcobinamide-phosphate guanylyltransferase [Simiduia agarivorans]AFU99287.1 adenosylcobinamide kinase/adenosylcobinamide-phosphate guanylyltransferase [Simiduia agarivorans SA1 = DSM 21679]
MRSLVLGGARSGKSRLAEGWLLNLAADSPCHYIATADRAHNDAEMSARIQHHQLQRDSRWQLQESPLDLAGCLRRLNNPGAFVLIDCLTLWLANALQAQCWDQERDALLGAVGAFKGELIMVSNEVGLGVVPMGELSRRFVDESGRLHQLLAAEVERVVFVAAGLPWVMKGQPF